MLYCHSNVTQRSIINKFSGMIQLSQVMVRLQLQKIAAKNHRRLSIVGISKSSLHHVEKGRFKSIWNLRRRLKVRQGRLKVKRLPIHRFTEHKDRPRPWKSASLLGRCADVYGVYAFLRSWEWLRTIERRLLGATRRSTVYLEPLQTSRQHVVFVAHTRRGLLSAMAQHQTDGRVCRAREGPETSAAGLG